MGIARLHAQTITARLWFVKKETGSRDVTAAGAGELSITVTPAAIGNAIYDATGARLRDVPFTPARVKAALHDALAHSEGAPA